MDRYGRGMISSLHELDLSRQLSNPIRKRDPAMGGNKKKKKEKDQISLQIFTFVFSLQFL